MAAEKVIVTKDYLENIADAIREKTKKGQDGDLLLTDMPDEIRSISGGNSDTVKEILEGTVTKLVVPDDVGYIDGSPMCFCENLCRIVVKSMRTLFKGDNIPRSTSQIFYHGPAFLWCPKWDGGDQNQATFVNRLTVSDFTSVADSFTRICYDGELNEWPFTKHNEVASTTTDLDRWDLASVYVGCKCDENGFVDTYADEACTSDNRTIVAYFGDDKVTDLVIDGAILGKETHTIDKCALARLVNLENVVIKNISTISERVFTRCDKLKKITFADLKTSKIDSYAFSSEKNADLPALTDIYVPWSEGTIANAPWGATKATIHYDHVAEGG